MEVVIVERVGTLRKLYIKDFKIEELYKKCGFKKAEDFDKQTEWTVKLNGTKYIIQVYGKTDGRANSENKYEFPPPIDNKLFYGNCAIIGQVKNSDGTKMYTNLDLNLWNKIYEKLYGGFEDLAATAKEDEEEEDELENIPKERKTKDGYLKDGFVVDSGDTEEEEIIESSDNEDDEEEDEEETEDDDDKDEEDLIIDDAGSELSEESYDYDIRK